MKALQRLHERAAVVTAIAYGQAYILRLDPAEAAELARREYDSTRPPSWLKKR